MRRLLLLRHAKAAPSDGVEDYDRALTERGREDARRMGDLIAARGLVPDLLIYSSAERTRETAEIVAGNWPRKVKSVAENGLYEASRQFMLTKVRGAACSWSKSMFHAGHWRGVSVEMARRMGAARSSLLRDLSKMLVTSPSGLSWTL